jgi:hypothetical protein
MVKISNLSKALAKDFPNVSFIEGDTFCWSPTDSSITYNPSDTYATSLLLHEIGHAQLAHTSYSRDVTLLSMETDAWESAKKLATQYHVQLDDQHIESHLDTYREWLHTRSLCPACSATGLQVGSRQYRCLACSHEWRVNEARLCELRRYSLK